MNPVYINLFIIESSIAKLCSYFHSDETRRDRPSSCLSAADVGRWRWILARDSSPAVLSLPEVLDRVSMCPVRQSMSVPTASKALLDGHAAQTCIARTLGIDILRPPNRGLYIGYCH